jgi:hypothetical protein
MDGALSLRFERNVPYVIAEFNGFQLVQIPHQILAHTSEHTRGEEQLRQTYRQQSDVRRARKFTRAR